MTWSLRPTWPALGPSSMLPNDLNDYQPALLPSAVGIYGKDAAVLCVAGSTKVSLSLVSSGRTRLSLLGLRHTLASPRSGVG